ncbi:MAG: leucine-rich repeat domain-containing protein, partial [Eubacterium sp.]|nr:leucine-rich repeat domain-containing protein [Eubacterium sp.]
VPKTRLGTSETFYEYSAAEKTLRISGSGATPNLNNDDSSQPWTTWRSDGSIEKVIIEEGITALGNYLLYQVCAGEVELPSTLKTIGNYALSYNSEVEEYIIPFGVERIGANAFEHCTSMKSVDIPDTVTLVSKNAFKQCYKLESVKIPYSVSSVGNYAFHRCTSLKSAVFESLSSFVKIGNYCFMNCPLLDELAVPLNATIGKQIYGTNDSGIKYENATMKVFSGSEALVYAKTKAIPYTLFSEIPLEPGAVNDNEFVDETVSNTCLYSFTPEVSQTYNIYSTGDVDLTAVLSDGEEELCRNDDISSNNLNFCLTYKLEAGRKYTVSVSSVRSVGEFAVIAYPEKILSFDIRGNLTFDANQGKEKNGNKYFEISEEMLEGFVLDIKFGGDFSDKIYYTGDYFNNGNFSLADHQYETPFTCGANNSYLSFGDVESPFEVYINHSYEETVVPYTVDDDGYSIFTCVLCKDTYKDNFVPTPAVTVSGKAYLMENPDGSHSHNIPYSNATFFANDRTYYIAEDGSWSVNTFDDLDLVFENENGKDISVHIDVEDEDVDFGALAFEGYDFNKDGYVNAKDFAIFLREKQEKFGEEYWKFAANFL